MKLNPGRVMPAACLMLSLTFTACKKNSNNNIPTKTVTCSLSGMSTYEGGTETTFSIQRDSIGRVLNITTFSGAKVLNQRTFQYNGNRVLLTVKEDYGINEIDSLILNNRGDIVQLKKHYNNIYHHIPDQIINMEYDVNGRLESFSNQGGYSSSTIVFQCLWKDGDLISTVSSIDTTYYSYTNKPFSTADGNGINAVLEYGQPLFKTAHLCSGYYDLDSFAYKYNFDSSGKVSTITATYNGGSTAIDEMNYTCN